jgi:hypothetical protein
LQNNRTFGCAANADGLTIKEGVWNRFRTSSGYRAKKIEDEISYAWDGMISRAHEGSKKYELVARELARPTRFERRVLAKTFLDARIKADENTSHDIYRRVMPLGNVTYCFLMCGERVPREGRKEMLKAICYVARGIWVHNDKVIGIATEKEFSRTCSYDFYFLKFPLWTSECQRSMEKLQQDFGIFRNLIFEGGEEMEYPEYMDTP